MNLRALQPADKNVALQPQKLVPRVNDHAPRHDVRIPEQERLLHAGRAGFRQLRPGAALYEISRVRPAVRDHGPAVVLPGLDDVDLVAALRTVLRIPKLAGLRM